MKLVDTTQVVNNQPYCLASSAMTRFAKRCMEVARTAVGVLCILDIQVQVLPSKVGISPRSCKSDGSRGLQTGVARLCVSTALLTTADDYHICTAILLGMLD